MPVIRIYSKHQVIKPTNVFLRSFSYFSLFLGIAFLVWAFYPIVSFQIYTWLYLGSGIKSPISYSAINKAKVRSAVMGIRDDRSSNLRDFIQASMWFPNVSKNFKNDLNISEYTISIPKLNIMQAKVKVGGEDLATSLVHFVPRSLPGEYGNVTILGHSNLPQLYNPDDYKTIFTYLPSLEMYDKIIVQLDGLKYEYEVIDMFVVKPENTSVLNPIDDGSYLTLVTCVPPGTFLNRLIVRAKLVKLPSGVIE